MEKEGARGGKYISLGSARDSCGVLCGLVLQGCTLTENSLGSLYPKISFHIRGLVTCRPILLVGSENRYICGEPGTEEGKLFLAFREIFSPWSLWTSQCGAASWSRRGSGANWQLSSAWKQDCSYFSVTPPCPYFWERPS